MAELLHAALDHVPFTVGNTSEALLGGADGVRSDPASRSMALIFAWICSSREVQTHSCFALSSHMAKNMPSKNRAKSHAIGFRFGAHEYLVEPSHTCSSAAAPCHTRPPRGLFGIDVYVRSDISTHPEHTPDPLPGSDCPHADADRCGATAIVAVRQPGVPRCAAPADAVQDAGGNHACLRNYHPRPGTTRRQGSSYRTTSTRDFWLSG